MIAKAASFATATMIVMSLGAAAVSAAEAEGSAISIERSSSAKRVATRKKISKLNTMSIMGVKSRVPDRPFLMFTAMTKSLQNHTGRDRDSTRLGRKRLFQFTKGS